jgi:hypothetical protein
VLPDTTPEQTMAGVAPDGVVIARVEPVILVRFAVSPVIVEPETVTKFAVSPVTVVPVTVVNPAVPPVIEVN